MVSLVVRAPQHLIQVASFTIQSLFEAIRHYAVKERSHMMLVGDAAARLCPIKRLVPVSKDLEGTACMDMMN